MECWVNEVKQALGDGNEDYKRAAKTIVDAMRADLSLTQKAVAEMIGRSPTWVYSLWARNSTSARNCDVATARLYLSHRPRAWSIVPNRWQV
jgi:hypothetical protein